MTIISLTDELLNKVSADKTNKLHLLIGNGFSLSHPDIGHCFEWDMHQAICSSWGHMIPNKSEGSPEKDLNSIRINITKKILKYYIDGLKSKISSESENLSQLFRNYKSEMKYDCSKFLSAPSLKGGYIFTLNYDPLLYYEILKLLDESSRVHFDGFVVSGDKGGDGCIARHPNPRSPFLNQDYIVCKLEEDKGSDIKVLYLHGSWFIQANEYDELRKLSFGSNSRDTINSLFEDEKRPFLILEDRWRTKKATLEADPYLKFCYDQLGKIQGNLLIFGCSFNNDEHVLQAISNNKSLKNIFVTYLTDKDKESLEGKATLPQKTEYIQVGNNVIWERKAAII